MKKPILLVEDTESEVLLMEIVMKRVEPKAELIIRRDGLEAIRYLNGDERIGEQAEDGAPGLVILDLDMPRLNGLQVLQWIRQQPAYGALPVIMFTSSQRASDVDLAYRLGASGYVLKPCGLRELFGVIDVIHRYWVLGDGPPPGCAEWLGINVPRPEGLSEAGVGKNSVGRLPEGLGESGFWKGVRAMEENEGAETKIWK